MQNKGDVELEKQIGSRSKGTNPFLLWYLLVWTTTMAGVLIVKNGEFTSKVFNREDGKRGLEVAWNSTNHRVLKMTKKGITIHVVSEARVYRECNCVGTDCHNDDGSPRQPHSERACAVSYSNGTSDIWIRQDDMNFILLHELCHADRSYSAQECEDMFHW